MKSARINLQPGNTGSKFSPPPAGATDPPPTNGSRPRKRALSPTEQYFLAAAADDEGNARCLHYVHGRRFLYCPAYGWLMWTGTHWAAENAEAAVRRAAAAVIKRRRLLAVKHDNEKLVKAAAVYNQRVTGVVALFRDMVTVSVSEFDSDPDALNCRNGVVDLRTGTLAPHDPAQRHTTCTATEYEPGADASLWLSFLRDALGDPSLERYIQVALGYSLTGHTSEECLFYLFGPTRSGKGTFTETLLALLGGILGKEVDFRTFTAKRDADTQNFDLAPLKAVRFLTASESDKYDSLNSAKIKLVTGGNEIYCAFKHRDHFGYRPRFTLWLTSNNPVNADPDDSAVWGRVRVISFPNDRLGQEDKTLKDRLKQPAALAGLLAWIVDGAIEWYASQPQGLQSPPAVVAHTQAARSDVDFVAHWAAECLHVTGNTAHYETNPDIYASYVAWCKDNGVQARQLRGLTRSMSQKFPNVQIGVWKWSAAHSKQLKHIVGVQIK